MSQALPLVTVMVGSQTSDQDVSLMTLSEDADEPRKIHFHLPTDGTPLSSGSPKWANYVKGVIQHYRGEPSGRLSKVVHQFNCMFSSYDVVVQRRTGKLSLILGTCL